MHLNEAVALRIKELCEENKLTALDLSKNTALETLYCGNNKITHEKLLYKLECAIQ